MPPRSPFPPPARSIVCPFSRRLPGLLALLLLGACAAPAPNGDQGPGDFDLSLGTSALPGIGLTIGASQRMLSSSYQRTDVELELAHQVIDDAVVNGHTKDSLNRIRGGLRMRFGLEDPERLVLRAGVVWLRIQGDAGYLDEADDYGGIYLGVAYEFVLPGGFSTGPGFNAYLVDSEGGGDSGWVPELAWTLNWGL